MKDALTRWWNEYCLHKLFDSLLDCCYFETNHCSLDKRSSLTNFVLNTHLHDLQQSVSNHTILVLPNDQRCRSPLPRRTKDQRHSEQGLDDCMANSLTQQSRYCAWKKCWTIIQKDGGCCGTVLDGCKESSNRMSGQFEEYSVRINSVC